MELNLAHILTALLAAIGFFVSLHIHTHKSGGKKLMCPLRMKCEKVVKSEFSTFLGVPLERIGMAYYLFMVATSLIFVFRPELMGVVVRAIVSGATFGAFIVSLDLVYVQMKVIKAWCSWCILSAVISVLIFALSFI